MAEDVVGGRGAWDGAARTDGPFPLFLPLPRRSADGRTDAERSSKTSERNEEQMRRQRIRADAGDSELPRRRMPRHERILLLCADAERGRAHDELLPVL